MDFIRNYITNSHGSLSLSEDFMLLNRLPSTEHEPPCGQEIKKRDTNLILNDLLFHDEPHVYLIIPHELYNDYETFALSRISKQSVELADMSLGIDTMSFLKSHDPVHFTFELRNKKYIFTTSVIGKSASKPSTYIANKPARLYISPPKREKMRLDADTLACINGNKVLDINQHGLTFVSNHAYNKDDSLEYAKLELPTVYTCESKCPAFECQSIYIHAIVKSSCASNNGVVINKIVFVPGFSEVYIRALNDFILSIKKKKRHQEISLLSQ